MKNVLVYGSGKSGVSASKLLVRNNIKTTIFDENQEMDVTDFKRKNPELSDVDVVLGRPGAGVTRVCDLVVLSPGIPLDNTNVSYFLEQKKQITGELELGFTYERGRVAAITGTNGKTTTTALVGHILKTAGTETFVAGNIGDPYTDVCDQTRPDSVSVLEVSSFQLETANTFHPDVCAILNITPDHLNRHKTMENYIHIKKSIVKNQKNSDICVLNYEDPVLREFGLNEITSTPLFFSSERKLENGLYLEGESICYSDGKKSAEVIDIKELKILGKHNHENAMAAVGICLALGLNIPVIKEGLKTFVAVEHRIEYVCEVSGVKYYNDSKATNTDAAIKGLLAMPSPTVLIAGGYDKNSDYSEWAGLFPGKLRHLLLIGVTAKDIAMASEQAGFKEYSFATDLKEAVFLAKNIAKKGDCVLLSPACASWDQFRNFEERGRLFKEYVRE